MKPTLALCMIVKDNAAIIERCLSSVIDYIDEAVIVDTGSEDNTPWVVEKFFNNKGKRLQLLHYTPATHPESFLLDVPETWEAKLPGKFTRKPFLANFAGARQFGWEKTNADYKFWLDSDDVFENAGTIPVLLAEMEKRQLDCAIVNYDYSKDERGNVNCKLIRERFFSTKLSHARWDQRVHEVIHPINKSSLFVGPNIVHKRTDDGTPYHVEHRNLKILLDWYKKNHDNLRSGKNFDIRSLFYLGMEARLLFPDEALGYFEAYIEKSGWDEERALAHALMGEIHERKQDYKRAYAAYAQATVDFPSSPDGLFGLARCCYYKSDFGKCIEFTERAFKGAEGEQRKIQVLMHDPAGRTWKPYVFYSRALLQQGRIDEALTAADKGLAMMPDEPNLITTKQVCTQAIEARSKHNIPTNAPMLAFRFEDSPSLDTPPQKIPEGVLTAFAIEMWKQLSADGLHVRAQQFLDALPHSIANSVPVSAARAKTRDLLDQAKATPVPAPAPKTAEERPVSRPSLEEPVIVTAMKSASPAPTTVPQPSVNHPTTPLKITIWTGPGYEVWTPENLDTTGIGGSETAAVCMARELTKRGHQVTVLGHCNGKEGDYDGVRYVHFERALGAPADYACDILVISRHVNIVDLPIPRKITFLWVHDIHVGDPVPQHAQWLAKYDKIFCLSSWHKEFFLETYAKVAPNIHTKIIITKNGLDLRYFGSNPNELPKKDGNRLIYSSSPDRGLIRLLDFLPAIKQEVPDVKLDVYYGFENWKKMVEMQGTPAEKLGVAAFEEHLGVLTKEGVIEYHGRVSKPKLAEAFMRAKVWSYPTWFSETSCLTAMEAQAAGCVPVTTALAALPETVSHGFVIKPPDSHVGYKEAFIKRVVSLLKDDTEREKYAHAGRKYAFLNHGWDRVAEAWEGYFNIELSNRERRESQSIPGMVMDSNRIEVGTRKLRLACIFGQFSSGLHGKFVIPEIFHKRAITGSESCFFNFVRGMAERGHQIDAICDVAAPYKADHELAGAHVYPFSQGISSDYDAFLSWNEPDLLRMVPKGKFRVCVQQLNDFVYCSPGFDFCVDLYVMPSDIHRKYLCQNEHIAADKTAVVPNSINWEMFDNGDEPKRDPYSLVWSSSPDRGLHVALRVFELVRMRHPFATFKIFYRFAPWYEDVKDVAGENGRRAREIHKMLSRLGTKGENGVFLLDVWPNVKLIQELKKTRAQIYTCEPMCFTEGFGVSVMDAAAAGCVPIVSDADAIAEIHKAAVIIKGPPSDNIDKWVEATCRVLSDDDHAESLSSQNIQHAKLFDRKLVSEQWEKLLIERIGKS